MASTPMMDQWSIPLLVHLGDTEWPTSTWSISTIACGLFEVIEEQLWCSRDCISRVQAFGCRFCLYPTYLHQDHCTYYYTYQFHWSPTRQRRRIYCTYSFFVLYPLPTCTNFQGSAARLNELTQLLYKRPSRLVSSTEHRYKDTLTQLQTLIVN